MKTTQDLMAPVQTRGDFRQLAESSSADVRRQSDTPDLPDGHALWELWDTLTEYYGAAFSSQYGEEPTWTWLDALKDLSTADYGVGIQALSSLTSPYPPNPGQFYHLCNPETPAQRRQREGTLATNRIARIPLPREEAMEQLRKLKEAHDL